MTATPRPSGAVRGCPLPSSHTAVPLPCREGPRAVLLALSTLDVVRREAREADLSTFRDFDVEATFIYAWGCGTYVPFMGICDVGIQHYFPIP